ncbi:hypothetical protein M885DRAFT_573002 [Pelagophyceae sp. CCMP2097]|nr:hypothetical protein M885DRAFT_573002 [Pelagophyceae sp. CCMP2097]
MATFEAVLPGIWTAHYHDIDTPEKLQSATKGAPITLVVNAAPRQCAARAGFFGEGIEVLCVDIEDDPDARKVFDGGRKAAQSTRAAACGEVDIPLRDRCAGSALVHFDAVGKRMAAARAAGGHVIVHCHASISRSAAFILAYAIQHKSYTLIGALKNMEAKYSATWPCDRFVYELLAHERKCTEGRRIGSKELAAIVGVSALLGAAACRVLSLRR